MRRTSASQITLITANNLNRTCEFVCRLDYRKTRSFRISKSIDSGATAQINAGLVDAGNGKEGGWGMDGSVIVYI